MEHYEDVSKIRAALELLRVPRPKQRRKNSWIKTKLQTPQGGMCIMGALLHVQSGQYAYDESCPDARAIKKVIKEQFPDEACTWGIPVFNDAKGRTFEDVELVLEKAAVLREEEGARSAWTLD